jgi:hypothetical protein
MGHRGVAKRPTNYRSMMTSMMLSLKPGWVKIIIQVRCALPVVGSYFINSLKNLAIAEDK